MKKFGDLVSCISEASLCLNVINIEMHFPPVKLLHRRRRKSSYFLCSSQKGVGTFLLFFSLLCNTVLHLIISSEYVVGGFNDDGGGGGGGNSGSSEWFIGAIKNRFSNAIYNTDNKNVWSEIDEVSISVFPKMLWMTSLSIFSASTTTKSVLPLIFMIVSVGSRGVHSTAIPRKEKLKKIYSLFKQGSATNVPIIPTKPSVTNTARNTASTSLPKYPDKLKIKKKSSRSGKHFQLESEGFEDDEDELLGNLKPKSISLSDIIPITAEDDGDGSSINLKDINRSDGGSGGRSSSAGVSITEDRITSILNSLYKNLQKVERAFIANRNEEEGGEGRKKSNGFAKNANELLQSLLGSSSSSRSIENESNNNRAGKRNLLMTSARNALFPTKDEAEEEALRKKILEKVEELDPLMCLPKVLCGYSSRRRRHKNNYYSGQKPKKHSSSSSAAAAKKRPQTLLLGENGLIDDYLELLKIVRPSTTKSLTNKAKEKQKKNSKKKYLQEKNKKKKKKKYKPSPDEDINDDAEGDNDDDTFHSRSGSDSSSSEESNESKDDTPNYEKYPIKKPKRPKPKPTEQSEFHKFLFGSKKKKKKKKQDEEDDEDENSHEDEAAEDELLAENDELELEDFDEDDMAYFVEKEKMNRLMSSAGRYSGENWWDPFDASKELDTTMDRYPYLTGPSPATSFYDPLNTDSDFITNQGGLTGWVTNMMGNIIPKFSWGGYGNGADEFKDDPFFTSFDSRSLTSSTGNNWRNGRNLLMNNFLLKTNTTRNHNKPGKRFGRVLDLEKLFGMENFKGTKKPGKESGGTTTTENEKDPAEKFRVAVEIGRRLTSPGQCDFIYNGCPLSYEEILLVINEPKHTFQQTTSQKTSTTTRKPNPAAFVRNKGTNFVYPSSQNYYPTAAASPQFITVPYLSAASSAPQSQLHNAYTYQQQQPMNPYQSQIQPQRQTHPYNQNLQQQQQQHYIHQHQPYHHQHHHAQQPSQHHQHQYQQDFHQQNKLDEFMAQVVGIDEGHPGEGGISSASGGGSGSNNMYGSSPSKQLQNHRHQTRIQQALSNGEQFEINLLYSDKNGGKNRVVGINRNGLTASSSNSQETGGASSYYYAYPVGGGLIDKAMMDNANMFNHKTLQYPSYEFSSSNGYKIQKKQSNGNTPEKDREEDDEKETWKVNLIDIAPARNEAVKINNNNTSSNDENDGPIIVDWPAVENISSNDSSNKNQTETTAATWKLSTFSSIQAEDGSGRINASSTLFPNPSQIQKTSFSFSSASKEGNGFNKMTKSKEKLSKYKEMLKGALSISSVVSASATSSPSKLTKSKIATVSSYPLSRFSPFSKSKSKQQQQKKKKSNEKTNLNPIRISLSRRKNERNKKLSREKADHRKKMQSNSKGSPPQRNNDNVDGGSSDSSSSDSNEEDNSNSSSSKNGSNIRRSNISNDSSGSSSSSSSSTSKEDKVSKRRKKGGESSEGSKQTKKKERNIHEMKSNRMSNNRNSIRLKAKGLGKSGKMKEKNKPNLHKQSSKSSEAKKGVNRRNKTKKMKGTGIPMKHGGSNSNKNGIYPVYGNPYYPSPPPYGSGATAGGYFHHPPHPPPPPTSTVASFFSYWFG